MTSRLTKTAASPTACDRPCISMSCSYLPSSSPVLRCVRGLGGSTARCSSQVCPQRAHQQKLLPFGAWRRRESPSHRGQGRHSPSSVIALVGLQGSRQISNISVIRQKGWPRRVLRYAEAQRRGRQFRSDRRANRRHWQSERYHERAKVRSHHRAPAQSEIHDAPWTRGWRLVPPR